MMTDPVALCDLHRVQVALSVMPEVLREKLTKVVRRIRTEDLWGGPHNPVVYFAVHGGLVKIGFTTNLKARVMSLSLRPRDIVLTLDGGRELEKALHEFFSSSRNGDTEWFKMGREVRRYIADRQDEFEQAKYALGVKNNGVKPVKVFSLVSAEDQKKALADILTVLGEDDRVRTTEVLFRLKNHDGSLYRDWDGVRLRRVMTDCGEDIGKYKGYSILRRDAILRAQTKCSVSVNLPGAR